MYRSKYSMFSKARKRIHFHRFPASSSLTPCITASQGALQASLLCTGVLGETAHVLEHPRHRWWLGSHGNFARYCRSASSVYDYSSITPLLPHLLLMNAAGKEPRAGIQINTAVVALLTTVAICFTKLILSKPPLHI